MDRILIGDSSEILVGGGLPDALLPERSGREQAVVIHQASVSGVVSRLLPILGRVHTTLVEVPDRDQAKTLEVVGGLYDRLADLNAGRHDTIVGVGGGAVTDLAGFVAATWLRGVESVLVPTTLLAAVDAAIGGKTGINHAGKNLVGAFWHPRRVVVDLDELERLPPALRVEGSAEIVKAGFIADPAILRAYRLHGIGAPLEEVATRAIRVKAGVVEGDFREAGHRAILNFGHTLGHGIEVVGRVPHGHAVAIGMAAAAALSANRFGFDAVGCIGLIASLGLPVVAPGLPAEPVLDLVARDKKRTAGGVRMVLLRDVADPVVVPVSIEELREALRAVEVR